EILRPAGVPRAPVERYVLREASIACDEGVCRDLHLGDRREIGIRGCGQLVQKEAIDPTLAESTRRQADAVNDDQVESRVGRTLVAVRRFDSTDTFEPTGRGVDDHEGMIQLLECALRCHGPEDTPGTTAAGAAKHGFDDDDSQATRTAALSRARLERRQA